MKKCKIISRTYLINILTKIEYLLNDKN